MAIKLNIVTQFDSRGIKAAQRELASVGRNIGRALDVAVIGGIAAATTGLVSAIKSASNFAAEYEGVSQVFGKAAESVQAFAKEASRTAGLSQTEALQASKVFGLFATKAGLNAEAAAKFSTRLVQLAGDLGSFNDVPTEEALAAIQSGLQGQSEPLRKFGVFLDDASLRAEALAMKIYDGSGALSAQEKMLASYSLILKQTNVQQGDYLKYADTFGNATKTITKDLANLQVELGQAVLPALESLLPAVRDLIPVLGAQLKAAIDSVDWKSFFKTIVDGITFLVTYGPQLAGFITTIYLMVKAFGALKIIIDLVTVSTAVLNGTLALNPFGLALIAVGGLIGGLVLLKAELDKVDWSSKEVSGSFNEIKNSKDPFISVTKSALGYGIALDGIIAKQATAGLAKKAANQGKGEAARYGAMEDFYKAKEIADAAKKVTEVFSPLIPSTSATSKKKSAAEVALDKATTALNTFKDSLKSLGNFSSLTSASDNLGQFEQSVKDTFTQIYEKIAEMPAKTKGLDTLKKTLASYNALLIANAQQRDAIIKKRGLAQSLIDDIKSTLMGSGNLASLLETQTRSVTTSVTKIVDGFSVTTKRTVDEVIGSKGVVGKLQAVVAKTKAFAQQLTSLKALGLDKNLFTQIVQAGPDVGGELAKEILDGGADSVKALNTTFAELQTVTAGVAEQTAVVMYNAGVEVAGGLVEGLLAQEAALVSAAQTLASAFNAAYQANIMALQVAVPTAPTVTPKVTAKTTVIAPKVTIKATPNTKADAQKTVSSLSKFYASNPIKNASPFTYYSA
jgi:hypothetical protein